MRGGGGAAAAGLLLLAGYVLWAKVRLYGHLEYVLDLFGFLQMASSFVEGRLPLFENGWGRHAAIHAYWTVPLLYPFVALLGAAGAFLVLVGTHAAAVGAAARLASGLPGERRRLVRLVAAALLVSPAAFWLVDDAPYGFHSELLFTPLAVLFAVGLLRRTRWALVAGVLLAATREEGPLVALAVHVVVASGRPGDGEPLRGRIPEPARVALAWGAVFVANLGLLLLLSAGEPEASRAAGALRALTALPERPGAVEAVVRSALVALGLLGSGAVVALAGVSLRPAARAAIASLPLLGASLLGGLAANYATPDALFYHGLSWAPRMAALWGVLAAALLAAAAREPVPSRALASNARLLGVVSVGLSFTLQAMLLSENRLWDIARRLDPVRLLSGEGFFVARLTPEEDRALRALARTLPAGTPVAATPAFFARLDRHDLVWPDRAAAAWRPPRVVVCDTSGRSYDDRGCAGLLLRVQERGWPGGSAGGLVVATEPALADLVSEAFGPAPSHLPASERSAASGGTAETRSGKANR